MSTRQVLSPKWMKSGLICAVIVSGLTACGTSRPPITSDALMQQANEAMSSGAQDKAADLLVQASKLNPTSDAIWVKLAQAQFERQDYPKAIDAATEALARSPNSAEARGIIFVSSMRLAVSSLSEIRADTPLSEGNKTEAEVLVKELRDTLGEAILIPGAKPLPKPAQRVRPRPVAKAAEAPATAPAAAPKPQPAQSTAASDPFGALR